VSAVEIGLCLLSSSPWLSVTHLEPNLVGMDYSMRVASMGMGAFLCIACGASLSRLSDARVMHNLLCQQRVSASFIDI